MRGERLADVGAAEALGRNVEDVEPAAARAREHIARIPRAQRRVDARGGDIEAFELVALIANEREQRRDDHDRAIEEERRELERERLASARRQDPERVAPGEHGLDEVALSGAKRADAEVLAGDALDVGPAAVGVGGRSAVGHRRACVRPFRRSARA